MRPRLVEDLRAHHQVWRRLRTNLVLYLVVTPVLTITFAAVALTMTPLFGTPAIVLAAIILAGIGYACLGRITPLSAALGATAILLLFPLQGPASTLLAKALALVHSLVPDTY